MAVLQEQPDCRFVALTVHATNIRARGLYRSMGFAETGEEIDGELVMALAPS